MLEFSPPPTDAVQARVRGVIEAATASGADHDERRHPVVGRAM
jgi:hypothetical protein